MSGLFNNIGIYDERLIGIIIFAAFGILSIVFGVCSGSGGTSETGDPAEGKSTFSITFLMLFATLIAVCIMFKQ